MDWTWADRPLERLLELGIAPIVDLLHYGVPAWMPNSFVDTRFPELLADFSARVAERFSGRVFYFTPLITADHRLVLGAFRLVAALPEGMDGVRQSL